MRSTNAILAEDLVDAETKKIHIRHICSPSENIIDLSIILLGVFERSYLNIKLTPKGIGDYNHYCEPDEDVVIPILNEDYVIADNKLCFFIKIGEINGQRVHYKKGDDTFTAICEVMHTPMRWNYWHFSIRWKTDEGIIPYEKDLLKKKWVQRLSSDSRSLISEFAVIETKEYDIINQECYMKN